MRGGGGVSPQNGPAGNPDTFVREYGAKVKREVGKDGQCGRIKGEEEWKKLAGHTKAFDYPVVEHWGKAEMFSSPGGTRTDNTSVWSRTRYHPGSPKK